MPPNTGYNLSEATEQPPRESYKSIYEELLPKDEPKYLQRLRNFERAMGFQTPIIWRNAINTLLTHIVLISWLVYNLRMGKYPMWQTLLFDYIWTYLGMFGVTAGAHRYWSHRTFKANAALRWILAICFAMSGQNSIIDWIRDHHVHHKFSDKSADPHNASRGFFFSHIGWISMMRHPDVNKEGRKIDLSEVEKENVVRFNKKYNTELKWVLCYLAPMVIPPLLWGESWEQAVLHRLVSVYIGFHSVWCINSFAHLGSNKPFDPTIYPAEHWWVSMFTMGEGGHNFHHTFPMDYRTSEFPYFLNLTTLLLDGFAALGWATNLKRASPEIIQATVKRTHKKLVDTLQ